MQRMVVVFALVAMAAVVSVFSAKEEFNPIRLDNPENFSAYVELCRRRIDEGIRWTEDHLNDPNRRPSTGQLFASIRRPYTEAARSRSRPAEIVEMFLAGLHGSGPEEDQPVVLTPNQQHTLLEEAGCDIPVPDCTGTSNAKYRQIDGTCNNVLSPLWGSASMPFRRLKTPEYEDGVSTPRGWDPNHQYNGVPLPSARLVSTQVVSTVDITSHDQFSYMLMQWGQFLDHDITFTPHVEGTGYSGTCENNCRLNAHPCFPIQTPPNDPRIDSSDCMGTTRSASVCAANIFPYTRQQFNAVTAFIDASQVYGSSAEEVANLRDMMPNEGKLRTGEPGPFGKPFLPFDTEPTVCLQDPAANGGATVPCFVAGDVRANEQLALTSMHTIWMREHNRIATELRSINPAWNGDKVFEETRKIIGAEMQVIAYKEWLPKILGDSVTNGLGPYESYDPSVDASISNELATAAFRFGHGLIRPFMERLDDQLDETTFGNLPLHEAFFSPYKLVQEGGIDALLRGLFGLQTKQMSPEHMVSEELTEMLFALANSINLDLAALNIQRGRDHGLPGYTEYRRSCGLSKVYQFDDLSGEITSQVVRTRLEKVYSTVDNIDLWVGGLAEEPVSGGSVGPTFRCILIEQFRALRDGDRFWYENPGVFSSSQRTQLQKTTLSRVLCDNGDDINEIQPDAFINAPMAPCNQLDVVSLSPWKEQRIEYACLGENPCGPASEDGNKYPAAEGRTRSGQYVKFIKCKRGFCSTKSCTPRGTHFDYATQKCLR